MNRLDEINLKKLKLLNSHIEDALKNPTSRYFDFGIYLKYFEEFEILRDYFKGNYSDLLLDLENKSKPESSKTTDFEGRGFLRRQVIIDLNKDIQKIISRSEFFETDSSKATQLTNNSQKIFISHGKSKDWIELQNFLTHQSRLETIELSQQANLGRTILQKLNEESKKCNYAIIVMSGDDTDPDGKAKARENVIHEIGFFQGTYGLDRVCILYEEGTSIPSNISGVVYIPYKHDEIKNTFLDLQKELKAAGF
ncbi:DNA-binding protein [Leptospira congkakensis]|uniref:DNA-binding protein n=1 Tax=Leptospira congkakensis TaxID=2484932 RepID=A0A4Z1A0U1_9LEPT|nr:nucleotide-binding protein [Leptospira congkakensis]TGL86668.1 DNA-binding protein [Leptospira congkakensis]TGL93787.1 DNA-binding protein [Leptospira congkakensis]TGL94807.1 DNA-binding protein [Leptospira congkakensis]